MSYCELFAFKSEEMFSVNKYKNSYGFLAFVWSKLWEKYIGQGNWIFAPDKLWDLQNDARLSRVEKIVLFSTFDYAMVKSKDFKKYADLLDEFLLSHPPSPKQICHLKEIASDIHKLIDDDDIKAIGFYGMSVAENLWVSYDEKTDEEVFYDIETGNKHWFVNFDYEREEY